MAVVAKKRTGSTVPPLEEGAYMATCCGVIDLGEQANSFKKGSYQEKALLIFEVAEEFVEVEGEQKPRWVSKEFTASLNEKAKLKEYLLSWIGSTADADELDLINLLGKPCQIQVLARTTKDGQRQYNDIGGIMSLPKRTEPPKLISETIIFDMRFPEQSKEVLPNLPEWIQEKIKKSPTWAKLTANSEDVDVEMPAGDAQIKPARGPRFDD